MKGSSFAIGGGPERIEDIATMNLLVPDLSGRPEGEHLRLALDGKSVPVPYVELAAAATSMVVKVQQSTAVTVSGADDVVESTTVSAIQVLELNSDYPVRLRETVLESDLAAHLDLACNLVGGLAYRRYQSRNYPDPLGCKPQLSKEHLMPPETQPLDLTGLAVAVGPVEEKLNSMSDKENCTADRLDRVESLLSSIEVGMAKDVKPRQPGGRSRTESPRS